MKRIRAWVVTHRKALVGYAGFVLSAASLAYPHDHWIAAAVAAATALGVHGIPNAAKPLPQNLTVTRLEAPPVVKAPPADGQ